MVGHDRRIVRLTRAIERRQPSLAVHNRRKANSPKIENDLIWPGTLMCSRLSLEHHSLEQFFVLLKEAANVFVNVGPPTWRAQSVGLAGLPY